MSAPLHRRDWLRQAGWLGSTLAWPGLHTGALAVPSAGSTRLLVVFLRGAYDVTNVLVPAGTPFYYEARPKLALRKPVVQGVQGAPADPLAALSLAALAPEASTASGLGNGIGDWALHPALRDTLLPLWQRGELAFVPFAGSHDLSRSHFETQDTLESGLAPTATSSPSSNTTPGPRGSGFLNRLAGALGGAAQPMAFTDGLPLTLTGPLTVPNVSLKGTGRSPFDARQARNLARMYEGTRFETAIAEGFELREAVAREAAVMQEMQEANRRALTAKGFEVEARRMAALMRERFNIGFIDVGGWDTHVNQGGAQGQLANLLDGLGKGLAGFADESGQAWDRTVVVVISEFGRTFRENGTGGTDHGHGTAYWVLGGGVRGGRILGEQASLDAKALHQNRDWPVLNEHRAVLGGLFRRLYGLGDAALAEVFPGAAAQDLRLL